VHPVTLEGGMSRNELKIGRSEKLIGKRSVQVDSRAKLRADSKSEVGIFLGFKPVKLSTCFGAGERSSERNVRPILLSHEARSQSR